MGSEVVVCKLAEEGAYLVYKGGEMEFRPQQKVEVIDNTGVGDVFNAGFLAGMLLGRSLGDCLAFAHRVAVKSLCGYGRQSYPDTADLEAI
mgnify:CR=1 FL=1